jgi:hypothetical protein
MDFFISLHFIYIWNRESFLAGLNQIRHEGSLSTSGSCGDNKDIYGIFRLLSGVKNHFKVSSVQNILAKIVDDKRKTRLQWVS